MQETKTPIQNQTPVQSPVNSISGLETPNSPAPFIQLESGVSMLKRSWEIFTQNLNLLGTLAVASAVVQIAFVVILPPQAQNPDALEVGKAGLGMVVGLISVIIAFVVGVMMTLFALRRTENWTLNSLFYESLPKMFPLMWVSFLTGLAVFLGFILFIIPGIYLSIALSFGMYIVMDQGVTGAAALTLSREYVKGLWGAVFMRFVLLVMVFIIPTIIVGIFFGKNPMLNGIANSALNAVITPVATIYGVLIYEQLKRIKTGV